jgi:chromosome segregation ATPase
MTNEELAAIRTIMREEVNAAVYASEQRMRTLVREEVNAAVYASEQRLGQRIDRIDERLDGVEGRLDRVDGRLDGVEGRLDRVDGRLDGVEGRLGRLETTVVSMDERLHRVEFLQTQMASSLAQMGSVLDEVTIKINELLMNYIALDQKVEGIKRDIQKLMYRLDTADEAISGLSSRLKMHRDTPINEAHPHSAA